MLPLPKGWIELTQLGAAGGQVVINVAQIIAVRPGDEDIPGSLSILEMADGKVQGVKEEMKTVLQKIIDNPAPSS